MCKYYSPGPWCAEAAAGHMVYGQGRHGYTPLTNLKSYVRVKTRQNDSKLYIQPLLFLERKKKTFKKHFNELQYSILFSIVLCKLIVFWIQVYNRANGHRAKVIGIDFKYLS